MEFIYLICASVRLETRARRPAGLRAVRKGGSALLLRNDMPDGRLLRVGQKEMREGDFCFVNIVRVTKSAVCWRNWENSRVP
jgi:hypothetical protein